MVNALLIAVVVTVLYQGIKFLGRSFKLPGEGAEEVIKDRKEREARQVVLQYEADAENEARRQQFKVLWPDHNPEDNAKLVEDEVDGIRVRKIYYIGVCKSCGGKSGLRRPHAAIKEERRQAKYNSYSEVTIDSLLDSTTLFKSGPGPVRTINGGTICSTCIDLDKELEYVKAKNYLERQND